MNIKLKNKIKYTAGDMLPTFTKNKSEVAAYTPMY